MLIHKRFALSLLNTVAVVNEIGVSRFVLSIHTDGRSTDVIFKDDSYPAACLICKKLGMPEPTTEAWSGI
jgi:hypothetical protein